MAVMVWINPAAAWESAVDAAAGLACDEVILLLVTEDLAEQDAFNGLLGPAGHEPGASDDAGQPEHADVDHLARQRHAVLQVDAFGRRGAGHVIHER